MPAKTRDYTNYHFDLPTIVSLVKRYSSHSNRSFYEKFYKNVSINSLQVYLQLLSFDTHLYGKKAKSAFRRIKWTDRKIVTWHTSNNKLFSVKTDFDGNIQYKKAEFVKQDYEKLMKPTCWRTKASSAYKSIIEQLDKELLWNKDLSKEFDSFCKDYNDFKKYFQQFLDTSRCLGTTVKEIENNVIILDLDPIPNCSPKASIRRNELLFEDICDNLYIQPENIFLKEVNEYKGSLHYYIRLDNSPSNHEKFTKLLENYLKENYTITDGDKFYQSIHLDAEFHTKILRFPFSIEYLPYNPLTNTIFNTFNEAYNYTQYVTAANFDYIAEVIGYYEDQVKVTNTDDYIKYIIDRTAVESHTYEPIMLPKSDLKILPSSRHYVSGISSKTDIQIHAGCRFEIFTRMVPYCVFKGMSIEDTIKYIRAHNVDSKDLNTWSDNELLANIQPFYNKIKDNPQPTRKIVNGYQSNAHLLSKDIQNVLHIYKTGLCNKMIELYEKHHRIKHISDNKKDYFKNVYDKILEEIFSQFIYDAQNKKYINGKYKGKVYKQYGTTQFSEKQLELLLAQHTPVEHKNKRSSKNDIHHLKNIILKSLNLNDHKTNHLYGYCKNLQLNGRKTYLCENDVIYGIKNHIMHLILDYFKNSENTFIKSLFPNNIYMGWEDFVEKSNGLVEFVKKIIEGVNSGGGGNDV